MQKNSNEIIKKSQDEDEKKNLPLKSHFWHSVISTQGALNTLIAYMASLVYFIHFNFAANLVRLVFFIFVVLYPLISLIVNIVISNNLNTTVLAGQDKLPQNAQTLDFEDDDDDIVRKAKILAVKRRVTLQRWAMTPIFITGFFKVLSEKDFPMQIYCAYIIEMCTLSLPILILMVINNAMLTSWQFNTIFPVVILSINLAIDLNGIIKVSDRMAEEQNEI